MFFWYFVGFGFFATHIPERYYPNRLVYDPFLDPFYLTNIAVYNLVSGLR